MNDFVDDLVALCRYFGMFERERVCCGTVTVQQCVVLQSLLVGPSEVGPLAESVGSSPSAMTRLLDGGERAIEQRAECTIQMLGAIVGNAERNQLAKGRCQRVSGPVCISGDDHAARRHRLEQDQAQN